MTIKKQLSTYKISKCFYTSFLVVFCCLFSATKSFAQFCYAKTIPSDTVSYSIVNADFNNDGFQDLASVDMGTHVSIFFGEGYGSFTGPIKYDIGAMAMGMSVITQDFNNDAKLDLAIADMMNMTVSILLGNGDGTFGPPASFAVSPDPYMLVSADFNNDGKFDIATANNSSNNISILLGNGTGTFASMVNVPVGIEPRSITCSDFNEDGNPDLLVGNSGENYLSMLLGDGNGMFSDTTNFLVGIYLSSWPQSVFCIDLNGDRHIDILSANGGDNTVSVFWGNGNATFSPVANFKITPSGNQQNFPQSITAADFNGDDKIDIATANTSSSDVSILLADGSGGFQPAASFAVGAFPYSLVSADFNKDSVADLAVANANSNGISLLLNCPAGRTDTIIKLDTIYAGITALNQLNEQINIYPNPNNGKFQIVINNFDFTKNNELSIYNLQGEMIFSSFYKSSNHSFIDLSEQSTGVYFFRLKTETGVITKKLIIQK